MRGIVAIDESEGYRLAFENGESISINEHDLPEQLRTRGSEVLVSFTSMREHANSEQSRDLLNYLLRIE